MRSTTTKPRHEAQMEHLPLCVTSGANGFRLAYQGGFRSVTVMDDRQKGDVVLWFGAPETAYAMKREAEGVTAAMLAQIFNMNRN